MTDSVKSLYKSLLRLATRYPQYNYRNYALRKIKEEFAAVKNIQSPEEMKNFIAKEEANLEQLKRMIKVQSLYSSDSTKLILETDKNQDKS